MQIIKIKKGLDIPLEGAPVKNVITDFVPLTYAIQPADFNGLVPGLLVKAGDRVRAGSPVLRDKLNEKIIIPSPVSGEVTEIVRGEKRMLLEIRIRPDQDMQHEVFTVAGKVPSSREDILNVLLNSGAFAHIRQRPYDVIPNPEVIPRDIYISTFDTSPLAPDFAFVLGENSLQLQAGIDALVALTAGKVHMGLNAGAAGNSLFEGLKNAEKHYFSGPHPAGNVGVQIHHTRPINKGDVIWYVHIADLAVIGKLMLGGIYDPLRTIAVTGPEVKTPVYIKARLGACIQGMAQVREPEKSPRYISGNVLTGTRIRPDGYIGFYHHQITVIPEGNYHEFIGWAMPGTKKFTKTRLFVSRFLPPKIYSFDTNFHGGERAYVMSGQYEKVFPFDIYPVYLIKAILANDIDKMEQLGIYEVSSEDFALCDFVCTSKMETQEIVHRGLELIRKEMS